MSPWQRRTSSVGSFILPLLVMTFILGQHFAWLEMHTSVETWDDDAGLFRLAMCFEGMLGTDGEPCAVGAPYPPLVPWVSSIFFRTLGGADLKIALFSLWPFLVLLCASLYMGFRRWVSPMAGLAAMVLGPIVVWSLHIRGKYYTEVPLAALCVASVVSLAASDGFRRRGLSVLLGLFLGLGLLTKWSFAFFLGPVAAVAMSMVIAKSFQSMRWGVGAAVFALMIPGVLLAGAAGWIQYGLTISFWGAVGFVLGTAFLLRQYPNKFNDNAGYRLSNIGLAVLTCVAIAGPWYWTYLPTMQEFLAANMAQKYHGDPVKGLAGWPFYPAVLLTRMMSTPLLILSVMGGILALRPNAPVLVRWALVALVSGVLILGILPYRSGRYLVAGLGLLSVVAVWPLACWPRLSKVWLPLALLLGLGHQVSWIPLAVGGYAVPHHVRFFTLPEPDLMGNTHHGIYQAYRDLMRPRWRFLPIANPPIHGQPVSEWVARQVRKEAGNTPSFTVVVDPSQRLNLNAMSTHLSATLPPATTKIVTGDGLPTTAKLNGWIARARRPRDQPATAQGPPEPRQLFVVWASPPDVPIDAPAIQLLVKSGYQPMAHTGRLSGFDPVGVSIWKAPGL